MTVAALGRTHVGSAPAADVPTLCFNYTVGFSWSVAVPDGRRASAGGGGGRAAAAETTARAAPPPASGVRAAARSHSLSQGYRAVLPTSLGRVPLPPEVARLGDLVRSSVRSLQQCAPLQAAAGPARGAEAPDARRRGRCEGWALRRPLGGYASATSGRAGRRRGRHTRVAADAARRDLDRPPFRRLRGSRRALRTGSPVVCRSGHGSLLHLGGRRAG